MNNTLMSFFSTCSMKHQGIESLFSSPDQSDKRGRIEASMGLPNLNDSFDLDKETEKMFDGVYSQIAAPSQQQPVHDKM